MNAEQEANYWRGWEAARAACTADPTLRWDTTPIPPGDSWYRQGWADGLDEFAVGN